MVVSCFRYSIYSPRSWRPRLYFIIEESASQKQQIVQKQRESLKDLELEDEDNREDLEQALELLKEIEDRIKHEKKARHVARASFSTKSHVQRRNEQSKGKLTCFFFFPSRVYSLHGADIHISSWIKIPETAESARVSEGPWAGGWGESRGSGRGAGTA